MENLYTNLMNLCNNLDSSHSKFYYVDQVGLPHAGNRVYRIFNYHFVSSTDDWMKPDAMKARGIMFEIDNDGKPLRIASRPMDKFFNYMENSLSNDFEFTTVVQVMDKADGSLISSYMDGEYLRVKSKCSLNSDQSRWAFDFMMTQPALLEFVRYYTMNGFTVNMEYCSRKNRIVLDYPEDRLIILNIRHNETGEYLEFDQIDPMHMQHIKDYLIGEYSPDMFKNYDIIETIKSEKNMEGLIVRVADGRWFKLKTQWYVELHHIKDSVNHNKNLVDEILNNRQDDLYALLHDDQVAIEKIKAFETHIIETINKGVEVIHTAYQKNRGKERKFYAIEGRETVPPHLFVVYMNMFEGIANKDIYMMVIEQYKRNTDLLIPLRYKDV